MSEECGQRSCGPFPEKFAPSGLEHAAHMPFPAPSPPPTLEKGSRSLWQRRNGFCPFRAAEWQLDQPSWSGRLRITAKGQVAYIKLEDRTSGRGQGGLHGAEVPRLPFVKGGAAGAWPSPSGNRGTCPGDQSLGILVH